MKLNTRLLRSHPLLALLPVATLRAISAESTVQELPKGTVVVREGEPCEAIYFVASGRCEARRGGTHGRVEIEEIYGPGDIFGQGALLNGEPYRATVTVLTRSLLVKIRTEILRQVFLENPAVAGRFTTHASEHLRVAPRPRQPFAMRARRIVAMLALGTHVHDRAIAKRLGTALHELGGQTVLVIHLLPGGDLPTLREWTRCDHGNGLCLAEHLHGHRQGYQELNLHVADPASDAIAPMLAHYGRHFDYVIAHVDPAVPASIAIEVLAQCDMAFAWLEPTMQQLYDFKLLLTQLCAGSKAACADLRPVVCVGDCGIASEFSDSLGQLGQPVHSFVRGVPIDGASGFIDRPGKSQSHCRRVSTILFACT